MYITVQTLANAINEKRYIKPDEIMYNPDEVEQAKQWLADVYHCSDIWGEKQTEQDMKENLKQWRIDSEDDDYTPDPGMSKMLADYWNELCDRYPC